MVHLAFQFLSIIKLGFLCLEEVGLYPLRNLQILQKAQIKVLM